MAIPKTHKAAFMILAAGLLTIACKKTEGQDTETDVEVVDTTTNQPGPATQQDIKQELNSAVYLYNDTSGVPEKVPSADAAGASPAELVAAINKYNGKGDVVLEYVKTSNDTVYVRIPDSDYLTRQMGTLGSHAYMATATYTLTEANGINYVNFDFEEGDHAAPGTYKRESFKPEPLN